MGVTSKKEGRIK